MTRSQICQVPTLNRREFLGHTTVAAALGLVAGPAGILSTQAAETGVKPAVGSNVFGWTQYYKRDKKEFNQDEVIAALADCGYDYLENFLDLNVPEKNAEFAEKLKARGMRPVSLYCGPALHEADKYQATVEKILAAGKVCAQAGFEVFSLNASPIKREKTDEELKTQVKAMTELGTGLKALGIRLGIHHHLPEMANQAREFHYNFKNSDPASVGFCYDVHWVYKGGISPQDTLAQYANRVVTWHLRQGREGVWWEDLDTGDVDYTWVSQYAHKHKMPLRLTVELALEAKTVITRSAVENHRRSREFVKRVFGV
jgi:inosose dehydratase